MNLGKTLFAQLMEFVPWTSFARIVARYGGDSRVRSLGCAEQFRTMAFAQLTYRESLRDIETCLLANQAKLYGMGFHSPIRRSTLADANEGRDWHIWADLAAVLIRRARRLYCNDSFGIDLNNTVYALDATTIDLCLSLFPWAPFRSTKAAIKLHTLLDLRGNIPAFIHISDGKTHEVNVLDMLPAIEAGAFYVMDRGYLDFGRLFALHQAGAFFVTRAKRGMDVYGELDEICFVYLAGRSGQFIEQTLGTDPPPEGAVLLTDGYAAYARYAEKCGLTHAQCWAHSRRKFFDAQSVEPERAAQALDMIGALYAVEKQIREADLVGQARRAYRIAQARPVVHKFFAWIDTQFEAQGLLPSSPFTSAMAYVRERRAALEVYLSDPDVQIDTNHLERALRVVPMGRRNWLFCWTEVGAKYAGIAQSLITTCRLHDIDPYTYLVDVLQRVGQHPAADVVQLTPRLRKQLFAANPLRSDLFAISS